MSFNNRLRHYNWAHLGLLLALPPWLISSANWADEIRLFGWLAVVFTVMISAEFIRPFRGDWVPGQPQLKRDGSILTLNAIVDAVCNAGLALLVMHTFTGSVAWPLWIQIIVGALLSELGSYTLHRWSHRGGWLWRVHVLHHRPTQVNAANALTAHPINAAYDKIARLLPLVLLGLNAEAILAITAFGLLQSIATHANVAGSLGWLNYFIGSTELHRLHHSTREIEAGNFGTSLPIWDQLFGTFRCGETPAQAGVFTPALYPDEFATSQLLALPFKR